MRVTPAVLLLALVAVLSPARSSLMTPKEMAPTDFGSATAVQQQAAPVLRQALLQFDQQKTFKVVAPGARLHANAHVQLQGDGQVGAFWQVARLDQPLVAMDLLSFQSLGEMQLLQAPHTVLLSPALPTDAPGIYVVQLSASNGNLFYLHYQVTADQRQTLLAPDSIVLTSPLPRQAIDANAAFLWQTDVPVAAYRYELYRAPQDAYFAQIAHPAQLMPVVLGQLVAAQQAQWQLDKNLLASLVTASHSDRYFWRVVGLGLDGATLCRSQLQLVALQF